MTHDDLNATDFTGSTLPMTHDELLEKIESHCDCAIEIMRERTGSYEDSDYAWFALRAVVELHKPVGENVLICKVCNLKVINLDDVVYYPCSTIQAIEENLHS